MRYDQSMTVGKDLLASEASRRKALDELLPFPQDPFTAKDGKTVLGDSLNSAGNFTRSFKDPDSLDALWGPLDQMRLSSCIVAEPVNENLDALLATWREMVMSGTFNEDSCMTVTWPSRDSRAAEVFYRHNFHPYTAIAVCDRPREMYARTDRDNGFKIREARPEDAEDLTNLWCELVSYDSSFGSIFARKGMRDALSEKVSRAVTDTTHGWTLLAEIGGQVVGFVQVSSEIRSSWISDRLSTGPSVYLDGLCITEEIRGTGVGRRLADAVHAKMAAAGIKACLLHYALANPLSVPFWSRMGYRPLWTTWRAQPASSWQP